jgi:hypothetical protein
MAIITTSGYLSRTSGLITNTNAFTILMAVKRTATQAAKVHLFTVRTTTQSTGHDLVIYDSSTEGTAEPVLLSNYATTSAGPFEELPLNVWRWIAIVGTNGTTITTYVHTGTAFEAIATTQTAFNAGVMRLGSDTVQPSFAGKYAHVREWNSALTLAQLESEILSPTILYPFNRISSKSFVGSDLTAAYTGQIGDAFTATGTLSIDTDEPVFGDDGFLYIVGDVRLPSGFMSATQTVTDFTQTVTVVPAPAPGPPPPPPPPATLSVSADQTFTFDQTATADTIPITSPPFTLDPPTIFIGVSGVSPIQVVGTGYRNATVVLFINGSPQLDEILVDTDGVWSTQLDLAEGTYTIAATQTFLSTLSELSPVSTFSIIASGFQSNRFRGGTGTGPRKAFRPAKTSKTTSWPTK